MSFCSAQATLAGLRLCSLPTAVLLMVLMPHRWWCCQDLKCLPVDVAFAVAAAPSAPLAGALPLTALRSWPSLSSRSTCRLAAEIAAYRRCVRHLHHALARSTSLPSRSRRCAALVRREHRQSCLHCRRWLRCRTCSCCWRAVKVPRVRTRSLPCHHELEFDVERGVHRRRRRHRRESEAAPRVHASSVSRLRG